MRINPSLQKFLIPFLISLLSVATLSTFWLKPDDPHETVLRRIPVQSGGRVKPFESFAREALLSVTGRLSLEGKSATSVVWQWISQPERWYTKSFLPVKYGPLKEELSGRVRGGKISPEQVLTSSPFQEKVNQAFERRERKTPLSFLEKQRIELYEKGRLFQSIAQGSLPGFIPHPQDPRAGWIPLEGLATPEGRKRLESYSPRAELAQLQEALRVLIEGFRKRGGGEGEGGAVTLLEQARGFAFSLERLLKSQRIELDQMKIEAELLYHKLRSFQWASIFYLASGIAWFFLKGRFPFVPLGFFITGFASHTLGFLLRSYVASRPPVTNMYESVIWVAWAAVLFSILLGWVYRKSAVPLSLAWVASFTLLIGESFPAVLDPSLSPLVPVLRNNYWLTVHVLTITLSYGAFALAWGLAHIHLFNFAFHPEKEEEHKPLGEYLYRALQIGVVLLSAGTILGGVWANASWGRFWGWDPKETWALIALFGYLVVLHGRFAGWLGPFGTAVGAALAFLGILMAWYGVNFVLAAGFHSYGFGGGGIPFVLAGVGLDLAFVSFLAFRYNKFRSAKNLYER